MTGHTLRPNDIKVVVQSLKSDLKETLDIIERNQGDYATERLESMVRMTAGQKKRIVKDLKDSYDEQADFESDVFDEWDAQIERYEELVL